MCTLSTTQVLSKLNDAMACNCHTRGMLADFLGISCKTLSNYESGYYNKVNYKIKHSNRQIVSTCDFGLVRNALKMIGKGKLQGY